MGRGRLGWRPYHWDRPRPASPADVERVETALGIRFPEDYRRVVQEHQGEAPIPNLFDFEEKGRRTTSVMGPLLHFREDAGGTAESYHILRSWELRRDWLPPRVIPFSEDPGGNPIAFDFRRSADAPPVVFVDHESGGVAIWPIAASFTEFLSSLYSEDEAG